jgi:hypothetical protein
MHLANLKALYGFVMNPERYLLFTLILMAIII